MVALSIVGLVWFVLTVVMLVATLREPTAQSSYMWRWMILSLAGTIYAADRARLMVLFLWSFSSHMWCTMIILTVWRGHHPPNTEEARRKREIIDAMRR